MMQLVLTVLAIALASLLAVGGINYFSTDIGVRVEVSQGLRAQRDILAGAVSNYRIANNGYVPYYATRLKGFLPNGEVPSFPKFPGAFSWEISRSDAGDAYWLCLKANGVPSKAAKEGVASFVRDLAAKHADSVYFGNSQDGKRIPAQAHGCGLLDEAQVGPGTEAAARNGAGLSAGDIAASTTISIRGN